MKKQRTQRILTGAVLVLLTWAGAAYGQGTQPAGQAPKPGSIHKLHQVERSGLGHAESKDPTVSVDIPMADLRENNAAAPAYVEMKSINFEPKVIQVGVGQKVIWENVSLTPHSATGDSLGSTGGARHAANSTAAPIDEKSFDTGLVDPKSESKPMVFMNAGSFPYHCSIHGKTMSGMVVVKGKM